MSSSSKRSRQSQEQSCCKRRRVEEKKQAPSDYSHTVDPFFYTAPNAIIRSTRDDDDNAVRFMNNDPAFLQSRVEWEDWIVCLKGPQGSGKTIFYLKSIAQLLIAKPDAKVIVTSSHIATLLQLYELCTKSPNPILPPTTVAAIRSSRTNIGAEYVDWNVLFCHTLSLHKHIDTKLDLFIIDELTASQEQDVSWLQHSATAIVKSQRQIAAIQFAVNVSARVLLSCAQMDLVHVRYFREITHSEKPILMLQSTYTPPIIRLVLVKSHATYLDIIWKAVINKERMAVAVGTKASAEKHNQWLRAKIQQHNKADNEDADIPLASSTCWTSETMAVVRKSKNTDLRKTLENDGTIVLWYTSALGPGTSINSDDIHYWTKRGIVICKNNGPSLNTMAQLPGRFRNICDTTIYCYIEPRKQFKSKKICRTNFPLAYEYVPSPNSNSLVRRRKTTVANEIRLDIQRERLLTSPDAILRAIQQKLDNAEIVVESIPHVKECSVWTALFSKKSKPMGLLYHTTRELQIEASAQLTTNRSNAKSLHHRGSLRVMELRKVVGVELLPPRSLHCNLRPTKQVFEQILKKPMALDMMRLLTTTTPAEFNATLANRLQELSIESITDSVHFKDRILPHEAMFLLSRLLLESSDVRARMDPRTLTFLRADLTSDQYPYLLGATLDEFVWEHGSYLKIMFTKQYRVNFRDQLENRTPTSPQDRIGLLRICCTQAGIGLSQHNAKKSSSSGPGKLRLLRHSANKPWSRVGIDLESLVEAIRAPREVVDLYKHTVCEECKTGAVVECLRQEGQWKCVAPVSMTEGSHRLTTEPLDEVVNATDTAQHSDSFSDSVLEMLGFRGGVQSELRLSKQDIEGFWSKHFNLRLTLLKDIDDRFHTAFATLGAVKIPKLLPHLKVVMASDGVELKRRKKQIAGKRVWLYSIIKI